MTGGRPLRRLMEGGARLGFLAAVVAVGSWAGAPGGAAAEGASSSPTELALVVSQDARVAAMARLAETEAQRWDVAEPAPFRAVDRGTGQASIVLPARSAPYMIAELAAGFPSAFETVAPGTLLLTEHIVVGHDARLVVSGAEVREVRLLSGPERFVTIVSSRGEIDVAGTAQAPVAVTSWDPTANDHDLDAHDGRAYVLTKGGRLDIRAADFSHLGFRIGTSSGVAWKGWPDEPSRGDVFGSRFRENYFGAYTFEAVDMRWVGNRFSDNAVYGFDPHDHSDRFVVAFNVASGNGRHGIIFSRGCRDNVVRFNLAAGNGWHGIVLDDGKVDEESGDARHALAVPSDDNVIEHNVSWGNGEVGVAVEGGTRNLVRGNLVGDNRFGIRLKDDASGNALVGNLIRGSEVFGVYLYNGSAGNDVARNAIAGGTAGVVAKDAPGTRILGNGIADIEGHGVALVGSVGGSVVAGNELAGRGSSAVDTLRARDPAALRVVANRADHWVVTPGVRPGKVVLDFFRHHPPAAIWAGFLLLLGGVGWPARRRWRRAMAGAPSVVPAPVMVAATPLGPVAGPA